MDVNSGQMDTWEAWAIAGSAVIEAGAYAYGAGSDIAGGGLDTQTTAAGLEGIWSRGVRAAGSVYNAYQATAGSNDPGPAYQPAYIPPAPNVPGAPKQGGGGGLLLLLGAAYLLSEA